MSYVPVGHGVVPGGNDAAVQLAEAKRLLAEAERIGTEARWRRDQPQAAE